jgi:hypothetical protein
MGWFFSDNTDKDDSKVVDVRVQEISGWFDSHSATVTLDNGKSATCTGPSAASAISDAAYKAKSGSWW